MKKDIRQKFDALILAVYSYDRQNIKQLLEQHFADFRTEVNAYDKVPLIAFLLASPEKRRFYLHTVTGSVASYLHEKFSSMEFQQKKQEAAVRRYPGIVPRK